MDEVRDILLDLSSPEEQEDLMVEHLEEITERLVKKHARDIKGQKGDKGDKGDKGELGPKGERGEQGIRGFSGQQGEQGERGHKGEQGEEGKSVKLKDVIEKIRPDILSRVHGGGNMNRNIAVGGNASVLARYTDLNIKPGANITLTYANNDTTKYVDLTIAAAAGSGITRSVSTVSVSSVLAATASTDIVIIANAGVQLTMPTAASNQNLYTIKNTGTSSVLIGTTGGQTIDTATTLIMPVQFTSVDLISDGTNWDIT